MIKVPDNFEAVSWFLYDNYHKEPAWEEKRFFKRAIAAVGIESTNMDLPGGQLPAGNTFYVQRFEFDLKNKKRVQSLFLEIEVANKRYYHAKIFPYMIINNVFRLDLPSPIKIPGNSPFKVSLLSRTTLHDITAAMLGVLVRPTC